MVYTEDVMNFIKGLDFKANRYFSDVLEVTQEKSIAVYRKTNKDTKKPRKEDIVAQNTFVVRVYWSKSSIDSERAAFELYDLLKTGHRNEKIGEHKINFIIPVNKEPIWTGRDANGICEWAIDIDLYYFV